MYKIILGGIEYTCHMRKEQYRNGRTALQLINVEDGYPLTIATVNVPEIEIEDGYCVFKNWSENEGLFQQLFNHKIVDVPIDYVSLGSCNGLIAKLLI